jgi:hypothetical protein
VEQITIGVSPKTFIDDGPSEATSDRTPTFTFSSDAPTDDFECRVDDGEFERCSDGGSQTTRSLSNGEHVFFVRAFDDEGNRDASPAKRRFEIDAEEPVVRIEAGPKGATNDASPVFKFSANERDASYLCAVDGAPLGSCSGPGRSHATGPLNEGTHVFVVQAIDDAGNTDTAEREFTVDLTPPDTVITDAPPATTAKRNPAFGFESPDTPEARFKCRLDDGEWKGCSDPKRYTELRKGEHEFHVRASDRAGNVDETPAVHAWRIGPGR